MTLPAFSFMTATEILFGRGQAKQAAGRVAALGRRVMLVHGATPVRAEWLHHALAEAGAEVGSLALPCRTSRTWL
jgi:alcohol dehydrogenase YqhD (iron-dependent ADH family)